jgi:mycothiol synthase
MSDSPRPSRPDSGLRNAELRELIEAAVRADGHPPFSDGALAELATGARRVVWLGPAAALVSQTEAEFVVHPDARRRGHGAAMLQHVLTAAPGELLLWAHGAHPAARRLAATHGLEPVRELLRLRADVAAAAHVEFADSAHVADVTWATLASSSGDAGAGASRERSVTELLELNGRAFAGHPEQGGLTREQFDALAAEPWFDPADVLLLWSAHDTLLGFCWLKIEPPTGEFYVVAVDPAHHGEGLGARLMTAGFERLAERGIREAILYVEADNTAALRLYRGFGFREDSIDIQYRWASEPDD